ncbi:MAG: hypothetical protein DCF19_13345 [Pseudanabaena frigida]|uniref:Uncharacterized protein n=1 Tax=Pseudanabaena frigida TaxID=945775 RepID=A0A2W4XYV5_9CYAN|nr:MAG: hypothetical protein DCF19_13345 [Pseudanabaena frigida]
MEDIHGLDLLKVEKEVLNRIFLPILKFAISSGLININRLSEADYIFSVMLDNINSITERIVSFDKVNDDFLSSAHDAIAANRLEVAVILLATWVENRLNLFYSETLIIDHNFDFNESKKVIATNNLDNKVGFLFTLVSKLEMDSDLRKRILSLADLRNQIVHNKAQPNRVNGEIVSSGIKIRQQVEQINFAEIFETIEWLSKTLEDALINFESGKDDYKFAQEAFDTLKKAKYLS